MLFKTRKNAYIFKTTGGEKFMQKLFIYLFKYKESLENISGESEYFLAQVVKGKWQYIILYMAVAGAGVGAKIMDKDGAGAENK